MGAAVHHSLAGPLAYQVMYWSLIALSSVETANVGRGAWRRTNHRGAKAAACMPISRLQRWGCSALSSIL